MYKKITVILMIALLMVCAGGCSRINQENISVSVVTPLSDDQICAVGSKTFSLNEALVIVSAQKKLVEEVYTDEIWSVKSENGETFEDIMKNSLEEFLVKMFSMSQMCETEGIVLTESEKAVISACAAEYEQNLTAEEAESGITEDDIYNAFEAYYIYNRLTDELAADLNTEISDSEARVMDVECIYIKKNGTDRTDYVKAVANEAAASESFATAAKKYNESGEIKRSITRGELPSSIEEIVFSMESGSVSGALESDDGYYIFYCVSDYDKEATAEHKKELVKQIKEENFNTKYNEFLNSVSVRFHDELWEKLSIQEIPDTQSDFFKIYEKNTQ